MKATSTKYLESSFSKALFSLSTTAGDLRLKASATEATFLSGPSLEGISLSVEKPGAFLVDVNVHKKDVQFKFMKSGMVRDKPVNIMCMHSWRDNQISVDGTMVFDPAHKVSVSHVVASHDCRVRYTYAHGESHNTMLESCYDTGKKTWDFALARKFELGNLLKGTYSCSTKLLGLEWCRVLGASDETFKVSASINMAKLNKAPKLMAERTWNFDLFESFRASSVL